MTNLQLLERRVEALEDSNEALAGVVNHLLETIFDERFIGKLDKLARNGEKEDKGR